MIVPAVSVVELSVVEVSGANIDPNATLTTGGPTEWIGLAAASKRGLVRFLEVAGMIRM